MKPFNIITPDNETIYAWHVMPLGLYAKHEYDILREDSGCAEDITQTKAFHLLKNDPESKLVINCRFCILWEIYTLTFTSSWGMSTFIAAESNTDLV